jgi:uncharacterized protein (TIGR01370 family)
MFLTAVVSAVELRGALPLTAVRTWAYQIQGIDESGAVEALAAARYDLLVVEPTRTEKDTAFDTPAMVRRLQASPAGEGQHRKLVLAYICPGEAEDWRWYWTWSKNWKKKRPRPADLPAFIVRPDPDGWSGCFPVAFWDPAWKDILLAGQNTPPTSGRPFRSVMDEVVQSGFDGVYLDWVEAYDDPVVKRAAKAAGIDPAKEMIKLIGEIRAYGRQQNPNFLVIQQNGSALLEGHPELLKVVDGIAQEDLWYSGKADSDWDNPRGHDRRTKPADTRELIRMLKPFRAAGKLVLTVDYTVQDAPETYRRARAEGFVPYCTRVSLGRLTTTPPPDFTPAPTSPQTKADPLQRIAPPPAGKIYHGVYPGGPSGEEDDFTLTDLRQYEQLVGHRVAWVYFSNNWYRSRQFPMAMATWIRGTGAVPFIRLMLRSNNEENQREKTFTLESIRAGQFDDDLRAWGQAAHEFGTPLIVEYGTEVNGQWFSWNGKWHGKAAGPPRFIAAYRHIVQTIRAAGADNVTWVFHVDSEDDPEIGWNRFENYYPGSDVVDWVGLSCYGYQTPTETDKLESFRARMDVACRRVTAMAPAKPIILCEFGATARNPLEPPETWADAALTDLFNRRWPAIAGFAWWNEAWENDDNPQHNTTMRLQDIPALAAVFARQLREHAAIVQDRAR